MTYGSNNFKNPPKYKKTKNWFGKTKYSIEPEIIKGEDGKSYVTSTGGYVTADDVVKSFRSYMPNLPDSQLSSYMQNMSDNELLSILFDEYDGNALSFMEDLQDLQGIDSNIPTVPTYKDIYADVFEGRDPVVNNYLAELQADEDRQTSLFKQQLADNSRMFDDYRQQVLSNQYQQNAQLMQTVGSEMSRARRNAIEAGASAGLRIAENVNTILSTQNKQSQLSLETSNQLAQQLLNQRQAAAGIRGEYNDMLSQNSAERRQYKDQAVGDRYNREMTDYNSRVDNWNSQFDTSSNSLAGGYQAYLQKNNAKNKTQSQYN